MKVFFIICVLFVFVFTNCEKNNHYGNINIPASGDGSIKGKVTLKGVFGEKKSDLSGVKVTLNNVYFTRTDTNGTFIFKNIGFGNYDILIEKEGFEPFNCSISFVENDTIIPYDRYAFILTEYPHVETSFSIDNNGNAIVEGKCYDSRDSISDASLDIILIGDSTNNINKENYDYISNPGIGLIDLDSSGCFKYEFNVGAIYGEQKKVYYRVYIASYNSGYNHLGTNCDIYICSKKGSEIIEYK